MRQKRSIHFRLTVWYALVLMAALGFFGGLLWFSMRGRLLSEADEELADQALRFQRFVQAEAQEVSGPQLMEEIAEFCQALPPSSYLEVSDAGGHVEFRYPDSSPPGPGPNFRAIHREMTVRGDLLKFEIGTSLDAIRHTMTLLGLLLLGLIPVVIAMASAGGAWLSRRALKPVDEITTAARTIGIHNLSERLPAPQAEDELRRLVEVWNSMLGRLEDAVKTLSQFAGDASHELRTPLAVIRTSAEVALRRARSAESYRESLHEIADEAQRMTELVETLLLLARSDSQAAELPRQPVDLRELTDASVAELRGLAESRRIRVSTRHGAGAAVVWGNAAALRRVFLVLLDNALKCSHADSEVMVGIAREGGRLAVTIQDFGIGIPEADQPHIFKRFYQADKARTGGGFGLGLSLAESIVRAHDASIDVRSVEGSGSTFRVCFVALDAEETMLRMPETEPAVQSEPG